MGESVYEGLTVGYCLRADAVRDGLRARASWYLRKADREFDPLADAVVDAGRVGRRGSAGARSSATTPPRAGGARDDRSSPTINVEALVDLRRSSSRSRSASPTGRPSARPSAVGFYAAGRQITGAQNGLAISGDYLSAASFLGIAGLIFLYGFDGFLYSIGFLVAFLTVMFLLAERMRNAGKYTIADVLAFRLRRAPGARRRGARHARRRRPST